MLFDRGGVPTRGRIGRVAAFLLLAAVASGCRVNKDDLTRWKKTVNGPDKLVAVLSHDKYERDLRVEAAWSLIEMPKRGGQAIGLARLIEELNKLSVAERREILDGLWKRLRPKVEQPIQKAGDGKFSDPAVLYKDASFALFVEEKLDLDPKMRDEMTVSLTKWSVGEGKDAEGRLQALEVRMDNPSQAYGVEQVLRKLGLPAATQLPFLLTAPSALKSGRLDSIARIVTDVKPPAGDKAANDAYEKAREELSTNFAAILKSTLGDGFINAVKPEIDAALKQAGPQGAQVLGNPEAYKKYMDNVRNDRLTGLFAIAKQVGRKPVTDVLLATALDEKGDSKHRALSLSALESNIDTTSDAHLKSFLAIGKSNAPDEVKHGALLRIASYAPEQATKAFYELFETPNWKVRYSGAIKILDLMDRVGDKTKSSPKDFLARLPKDEKTKFALGEPGAYGSLFAGLKPELKAKEAIDEAIKSDRLGAQLTALGWYYAKGTKDDLPMLAKYETDKSPVPKCKEEDECGWEKPGCPIPKAGGKPEELEYKSINTVGEYVQFCVKPEIEKRAKAPPPAPPPSGEEGKK